MGGLSLLAVGFVVLFNLAPILERFHAMASSGDVRLEAWPTVLKAAAQVQPFGGGIGSFETLYRASEPLAEVTPTYFNHAHNDYLEIWLEAGSLQIRQTRAPSQARKAASKTTPAQPASSQISR